MTDQEPASVAAPDTTATVEPQSTDNAAPAEEAAKPEESAPTETPGAEPAADEPDKKTGGVQKRINELTQERYREKLRADALERELDALRKPQQTAPSEEPKIDDYDKIDDFLKARDEWMATKLKADFQKDTETREGHQKVMSQASALKTREDATAAKYPDYWDTTRPIVPLVMTNPTLKQYMIESDHSAEVGYHLAKNPDVLDRLLRASPTAALRELFSLEAKATAAPPPKATTKAPAPVAPLGGREPARKSLTDLADKDMDGYRARRTKQRLAKLASG